MNLSYALGWCVAQVVFRVGFRARFYGAEQVPCSGPVILAANHASYLDPPLVGAGLRRKVHFLARNTLFDSPLLRAVLRSWEVVPVDRDGAGAAGLKAILERLRAGGAILLFPEGTRTHDGRLQRARAGIGLVIAKSTCPVVPVRVFGTYEAWGRYRAWPRPHRLMVKYGAPLDFAAERALARTADKARLKALYREIANTLMAHIAALPPYREVRTFPA